MRAFIVSILYEVHTACVIAPWFLRLLAAPIHEVSWFYKRNHCKRALSITAILILWNRRITSYCVFTLETGAAVKWRFYFTIPRRCKVLCFFNQNPRHPKVEWITKRNNIDFNVLNWKRSHLMKKAVSIERKLYFGAHGIVKWTPTLRIQRLASYKQNA